MADVVAVLVVCEPGSPLLAPGRCNGTAPVVYRCGCGEWGHFGCAAPWAPVPPRLPRALPLWWDGALVPEGWDRAQRVAVARGMVADWCDGPLFQAYPPIDDVLALADALVGCGAASRVVRLARTEAGLVEVSP